MKRREPLTPDITPLIDIVFLLLIFFMVSSVFKKEELALLLNLPKVSETSKEIEEKEINLELNSNELAYNGKKVSFENLSNELSLISKKEVVIILRIDKEVKYERIIQLLEILQKYDLNNLALINETKFKN